MIAVYDLRHQQATFEFFQWLVLVQAKGATKIAIDRSNPKTSKIPREMVLQRHDSILVPGIALSGLKHIKAGPPAEVIGRAPEFRDWIAQGNTFKRLESVESPCRVGSFEYTVTLRHNPTAPKRNTNELVWRQFAQAIGALVIPDYSDVPLHLHDRMALYAAAKMNFGVCNGPVAMLGLTPYPVTVFVSNESARKSQRKDGYADGTERFPWMLPHQRLVWQPDTIENLMAAVP